MVNTIYLLSFVETPRKFIIAIINLRGVSTKLNKYKSCFVEIFMQLENESLHVLFITARTTRLARGGISLDKTLLTENLVAV